MQRICTYIFSRSEHWIAWDRGVCTVTFFATKYRVFRKPLSNFCFWKIAATLFSQQLISAPFYIRKQVIRRRYFLSANISCTHPSKFFKPTSDQYLKREEPSGGRIRFELTTTTNLGNFGHIITKKKRPKEAASSLNKDKGAYLPTPIFIFMWVLWVMSRFEQKREKMKIALLWKDNYRDSWFSVIKNILWHNNGSTKKWGDSGSSRIFCCWLLTYFTCIQWHFMVRWIGRQMAINKGFFALKALLLLLFTIIYYLELVLVVHHFFALYSCFFAWNPLSLLN